MTRAIDRRLERLETALGAGDDFQGAVRYCISAADATPDDSRSAVEAEYMRVTRREAPRANTMIIRRVIIQPPQRSIGQ